MLARGGESSYLYGPLPPTTLNRPDYHGDLDDGIDYYEVLGVVETSTPEQILSAFRVRIREVHPDLGGDHDTAARLLRARRVLTGDERADYDAVRAAKAREVHEQYLQAQAARRDAEAHSTPVEPHHAHDEASRPFEARVPQPPVGPKVVSILAGAVSLVERSHYPADVEDTLLSGIRDFIARVEASTGSPISELEDLEPWMTDELRRLLDLLEHPQAQPHRTPAPRAARDARPPTPYTPPRYAPRVSPSPQPRRPKPYEWGGVFSTPVHLDDASLEVEALRHIDRRDGDAALRAVSSIVSLLASDRAYAAVALHAAKRGMAETASTAASRIISIECQDRALEDAAVALASARQGQGHDAVAMAGRIVSLVSQDRALASVAIALGQRGRLDEARHAANRIGSVLLSSSVRQRLGLVGY